jgi:fumarate reductase subunit C
MSTETMRSDPPLKAYHPRLSPFWWLQNRRYFLFMLREFTAVPIVLWLLVLLADIARLGAGPPQNGSGYQPLSGSPLYVAFSAVCLVFALLHSITWLGISGLILRVPLGERDLPPRAVTGANFALWGVATVVVGGALIFLGG